MIATIFPNLKLRVWGNETETFCSPVFFDFFLNRYDAHFVRNGIEYDYYTVYVGY